MASLYKDLVRAGIPTDHHESDLYVLDTPAARETIKSYGYKFKTFTSNIDGKRWIDVPFAYEPFWEKKASARKSAPKRAHATVKNLSAVEDSLGYRPEPRIVDRAEAEYGGYSTSTLRRELQTLEDQFEKAGGRGVDLAERLDAARIALALRGSKARRAHATSAGRRSHSTKKTRRASAHAAKSASEAMVARMIGRRIKSGWHGLVDGEITQWEPFGAGGTDVLVKDATSGRLTWYASHALTPIDGKGPLPSRSEVRKLREAEMAESMKKIGERWAKEPPRPRIRR